MARLRNLVQSFGLLVAFGSLPIALSITTQGGKPQVVRAQVSFDKAVRPVLKEYCVNCHTGSKPAGNLALDTLPSDFLDARTNSKWAEVVSVLNARQMPPSSSKQLPAGAAESLVEAITAELAKAEISKRPPHVVLRRMNRAEYNNTIRDLLGVDFQPAERFPEDPPAGGFDNIGQALSLSPLQMELYYAAAREVLDRALLEGPKPATIKWRFEPEMNRQSMDAFRVERDGNRIILNCGNNPIENGLTVIHHDSWDKSVNFRDFRMVNEGEYIIRIHAAGRVPTRSQLVEGARGLLARRQAQQDAENPNGKRWSAEQFANDLRHFQTHRMYEYGPPRMKVTKHLGSAPLVVAEMDVDAQVSVPKSYEIRTYFTRESAGVDISYAYAIPSELENFWMQSSDQFPRPELLIDWIELEGPITPAWPPASTQAVLFESPTKRTNERVYAREVLAKFMRRAYRRPVTGAEVDAKLSLFDKYRSDKPSFVEAIKVPLSAVLTSPHFLFLAEPDTGKRQLTSHEIASRLSYFLWSTMPDSTLFGLADAGTLARPEVLDAQVDRMLADPKASQFVKNFAGQWLNLRKVGSNPPVPSLYREYDRHLELSIVRESEGFFDEILKSDTDVRAFIKSDFVTINERLARFYGIPGVRGDAIRRVPVPKGVTRGGLVTQASILSLTSNGTRTSPVVRGVWVLRTLLGTDPGLPVANVGEIASKVPGIDKATVRERLQIHRQNPSCARCHDKIDPIGFSLENFNAAGEWREREGHGYQGRIEQDDPMIDARAKMPDGTDIVGVAGLQEQLLRREDLFLRALASQLTTYALGRELGFSDQAQVQGFVATMKKNRYTLRSLIHSIVKSAAFQAK